MRIKPFIHTKTLSRITHIAEEKREHVRLKAPWHREQNRVRRVHMYVYYYTILRGVINKDIMHVETMAIAAVPFAPSQKKKKRATHACAAS